MQLATFDPTAISFDVDEASVAEAPVDISFQTIGFDEPEMEAEVVTTVTFGMPVSTVAIDTPVPVKDMVAPKAMSTSRQHLVAGTEWSSWSHLRDYVVSSIEETIGAFPRNPVIEKSIFSSFFDRWGPSASQQIARSAVELHGCWWRNSPISVQRFCKGSDPYFAEPIARNLGLNTMSLSQ
jgi:hypothetical protein